jgi:hypothetical protein
MGHRRQAGSFVQQLAWRPRTGYRSDSVREAPIGVKMAPERSLSRQSRMKELLGRRFCAGREVLAAASNKATLRAPIVQNLRRSREFPFLLVKVNRFTNYTLVRATNNK